MAAKLDIKRELSAVDLKNYNFYDKLTDEEKKVFSPYILMRYTASVQGDRDIQEWFLERTNEMVNKNHWDLSKNHKSLLWKLFAATGAGVNCYHRWERRVFKKRLQPDGKPYIGNALQNTDEVNVNDAVRQGAKLPKNDPDVAIAEIDKPNKGRY